MARRLSEFVEFHPCLSPNLTATAYRARCVFVGMGLELYHHSSQAPFTNVLFANVVAREDLSDIDMVGRRVWSASAIMATYHWSRHRAPSGHFRTAASRLGQVQDGSLEARPSVGKTTHRNQQVEWCASTEYNGSCNVVPMTSAPVQRLPGPDGLWETYIGVGGLSIPPGTSVSLGLRIRSSTQQRSDWCWSAETIIGQVIGPS